ncbi:hypothetical protein [Bradyrhizobium diazoefficiens]|uniref:hypothetical protein n=1 Tax=Bradyrhizobium diazoefficiens TaxID=1355477 RepID=UPI00272A01E6|nr:hypothetical protein [Bradyrhizobium diazoefficiens]WLA58086.1 hypothetical protein QIH81_05065 [Bradyrhizobium diazoefficiens]
MNAGECVRRLFFVIFAPDSQQESSPLSGRKSTQATVRICGASSILLEHQLREDGDDPLILSKPGLPGMEPRLAEMGFVHVGRNHWVLDPHQHPEVWTKNENDQWQRVGKPTKYLSKVEDDDAAAESTVQADYSDEDDPSVYLERVFTGLSME